VRRTKPLIGIPADRRLLGLHPFHCVGEKYIEAVALASDAIPVLIPVLDALAPVEDLLDRVDGVLLTGSASNVEPHRYSGPASVAGTDRVRVNSVHGQGVQTLGGGLEVEATAPDGLVEAFRVRDARNFAVAVQWHPEWQVMSNPFSKALFAAFGDAARERAQGKRS
jgi:gamma-glutamyl-gamma-aminobutyrate hydrolase PuuD